ncbi:uncharacterized protein N7515_005629 [Penicillium bovifimosum]|uniref:Protein Zds1 C-terminal domain-containing protein n=1 Tax=Penicillium bovifimosum TaxID=126998 RepID=A0A9W9L0B3_9EURO|nr:uncharacterized protein N7515_005629 [Penicillium bovifimosum]KAJ5129590.1 hypothetical protein N7515_005629 [Penicillium bovifimosum]
MSGAAETSTSPYEDGGHATRRGHAPHLSISDPSHHVTEAIGHMYDDDYDRNDPRRLSYITSPLGESITTIPRAAAGSESSLSPSSPLHQSSLDGHTISNNGNRRPPMVGNRSFDRESDSGLADGTRSPSETATSSFPINNVDYESNPAAVAQELNNLAAIRRMSMDVAAAAPKEFKSFLDSKADQIKRRSADYSTLGPERPGSAGGLNRKRSMLSRQIDSSSSYTDGADRLERQRSQSSKRDGMLSPNLQQLETLVDDSKQRDIDPLVRSMQNVGIAGNDDKPILPPAPPGNSLRRSTRTQYKKAGSLKKGEKLPYSKRVGRGQSESAGSDPKLPVVTPPDSAILGLTRVSTDPTPKATRAGRAASASASTHSSGPPGSIPNLTFESIIDQPEAEQEVLPTSGGHPDGAQGQADAGDAVHARQWHSRISSNGRSTLNIAPADQKIPAIIETPPATEHNRIPSPPSQNGWSSDRNATSTPPPKSSSSHDPAPKRPKMPRQPAHEPASSLNDFANNPELVPGNNTRTDSLSFIPTIPEERKSEERKPESKRSKDKKDSEGRKSSWHWLLGSEERDKKRDKEKDSDSKRTKSKTVDKAHDSTRLDVLQSSIDSTPRGRESLVLDRLDPKLEEERRKDSVRRTSGDSKKEKDGIFSSIFGGGRKKHGGEGHHRKHSSRNLSLDPPMRVLRADVDYPWTRFSIMEERAIYRLAHMKLANPRRALYSQVLLSNFMYSYLAKVQQMHPQTPAAPSASSQRSSKSRDQPEEYLQYQRYQDSQEQQHYGDSSYDDPSMYDYDDDPHDRYGGHSRGDTHGYDNGQLYGPEHYQYGHSSFGHDVQLDDDDDDDMW